jgi:hypothetical protein
MTDFIKLKAEMTRENALDMLAEVPCPECGAIAEYRLFTNLNNNGVGIECTACGKPHPFIKEQIMWVPREAEPQRSNNLAALIKECGAYCYHCGADFADLKKLGIGATEHHTKPFAKYGDTFKTIPYCTRCHESANAAQRWIEGILLIFRKFLDASGG